MKKSIILFAAFFVAMAFAVNAADFSGNWKLNKSKSKLGDQFSMAPSILIAAQSGNDFNVEKHISFQDQEMTTKEKYTLDGKESINPGFQDSQKKSTAVWSGDKNSLTITSKLPMGDNDMTTIEVYKIVDGNLVIESKMSSSFGENNETMVFEKQ
jgi:hypothetical protein